MPEVSIIVPNYNHAGYLKRRLDSIIKQTYADYELIILDDNSTDNSRDVIEQYRNYPKVSHIEYNVQNSGSTFKQWEKGIRLSRGKYIWIAESDDFCEPMFLEELVPPLKEKESIAIAFCQTLYISTENRITYRTGTEYLSDTIDGIHFLRTRMLGNNTIVNASMAVFRKSLVDPSFESYTKMKYCGDWLFWVNLCFKGDVYVSGKYLNYYLRHGNNVASNATRQGYDFLEGNEIYHLILSKTTVEFQDKENALNERVNEYLRARESFLDETVHRKVEELMLKLDPAIGKIINRKTRKEKVIKLMSTLNRMLP